MHKSVAFEARLRFTMAHALEAEALQQWPCPLQQQSTSTSALVQLLCRGLLQLPGHIAPDTEQLQALLAAKPVQRACRLSLHPDKAPQESRQQFEALWKRYRACLPGEQRDAQVQPLWRCDNSRRSQDALNCGMCCAARVLQTF